jgi:predicted SAM-dependent methyltransferase
MGQIARQWARLKRKVWRTLTPDVTRALLRSEFYDPSTHAATQAALGEGDGVDDSRRVAITISYMRRFGLATGRVVEIGNLEHPASQAVWQQFPTAQPTAATNDFRKEPLTFADGSVDSLLCLEVIEHLSDPDYGHATTLSGVFYFLEEVYRVLAVGGKALFTTPNAASLLTIERALRHQPPLAHPWHFREFTVDEVRRIVESVGFQIEALRTEYVWMLWDLDLIRRLVRKGGYSMDDRGDDIFMVVSKPATRHRKPHNLDLPVAPQ